MQHLPIYFSGASDAAVEVAAKHADVYMMWGEPLEQVRERIAKVRKAAARYGREKHIRFSLSLRPILGGTEAEAWARAERILADAQARIGIRQAIAARKTSERATPAPNAWCSWPASARCMTPGCGPRLLRWAVVQVTPPRW